LTAATSFLHPFQLSSRFGPALPSFFLALIAAAMATVGGREAVRVARLSAALGGGKMLLMAGWLACALACVLAARLGAGIAAELAPAAKAMLVAIALLLAGLELLVLRPGRAPAEPTRSFGAALLVLVVFATGAFLAARPDLPARADLPTVSRLLAANEVTLLDLRGETLTLTERSGERLRVEGVNYDSFQPIMLVAIDRSVTTSVSNDPWSLTTELGMIATSVLPLLLLGAALLLVARAIRRPPRVRAAG